MTRTYTIELDGVEKAAYEAKLAAVGTARELAAKAEKAAMDMVRLILEKRPEPGPLPKWEGAFTYQFDHATLTYDYEANEVVTGIGAVNSAASVE